VDKLFIGEERLALENKRIATLKYFLLEEAKFVEETKESEKTYGIYVEKWNGELLETEIVKDITTKKENAMQITKCLKRNKVMPIHLKDVIVDML
jgi:hypothetical protein